MAASPGHQMLTNSFHVIRSPIAVLTVAPFSPARDLNRNYSTRNRHAKAHQASIIPRKGAGFESLEPTSPEVGCMGQIRLKQKWTKASEHRAEKKPRSKGKLSKLRKFIFGSHGAGGGGDCGVSSVDCPTVESCKALCPTLGQLKRYASGSYDAKFGDIYTRPQPFMSPSGWLSE